jgi:hypothetical protein
MSRRDWLCHVVITGFLIGFLLVDHGGVLSAQEPSKPSAHTDEQQSDAKREKPAQTRMVPSDEKTRSQESITGDAGTAKNDKPQTPKYRSPCGETEDHDQADLCEQQRMSAAAERAADYAFWQLIAGGIGIPLIVASLIFAGIAAFAARDAAIAARDQAFLTEQTAKRQLRAYVHVEEISMRYVNSEWAPNIRIRFKNFGFTPALRIIHKCSSSLVMVGDPKMPDREQTVRVVDLGPSQDQTTTMIIPLSMWNGFLKRAITSGAGKFFVFGVITYFDTSQDQNTEIPHATRYRMYISPDDEGIPEDGGFVFADEGNETT